MIFPSPFSEGTNRATPSRFWLSVWSLGWTNTRAHALVFRRRCVATWFPISNLSGTELFTSTGYFLICFIRKWTAILMKCTTKHKNLLTTSDSFVFRSSENKDKQELPVKQKTNVSKDCNSADIVSKVVGLEKQAWKHRSDSKSNDSEMPAGVNVKQPNTELINVQFRILAAMNKER